MPGHLGDERVTVQNLQVIQVREADKIILVSGAVPGSKGSYVVVRPAIKNPAVRLAAHEAHAKADAAALAKKPKKAGEIAEEKAAKAKEAARK
jgi:large subunit ribosomal protein L3